MRLLDSDMLSLLMNGDARVTARAKLAGEFTTTVVTKIVILLGRFAWLLKAESGEQLLRAQHWLYANEQFLAGLKDIVPFDAAAAAAFDRLRQDKKLKKIGRADLLIASIVLANRATLVTRNLRHFRLVPGLRVENWVD